MSVLVAVDFSPVTAKQLAAVRHLAEGRTLEVYLIHVVDPKPEFVGYGVGPDAVRQEVEADVGREQQQLDEVADALASDTITVTPMLVQGPTVETLLREAKELDVGLIVVGSHGHGAAYELVVGGFSNKLIRKAPLPVLVVPARVPEADD
jgi:nucleotide-binding universal stress UspA family protein